MRFQWFCILIAALATSAGCNPLIRGAARQSSDSVQYVINRRDSIERVLLVSDGAARVDFRSNFGSANERTMRSTFVPANPMEISRVIRMVAALIDARVSDPILRMEHGGGTTVTITCTLAGNLKAVSFAGTQRDTNLVWGGALAEIGAIGQREFATAMGHRDEGEMLIGRGNVEHAKDAFDRALKSFNAWDRQHSLRYGWLSDVTSDFPFRNMRIQTGPAPTWPEVKEIAPEIQLADFVELQRHILARQFSNVGSLSREGNVRLVRFSPEFAKHQAEGTPTDISGKAIDLLRNAPPL